jgi:hypothetical protein
MGTPLKNLGPSEAFEDAAGRSVAAAAGGFLVFGCLQAAGALPTIYRESLFVASGMLAAFPTSLGWIESPASASLAVQFFC